MILLPVGPGWREFLEASESRLWHVILAGQTALWVAALVTSLGDFRKTSRYPLHPTFGTLAVMGVFVLVALSPTLLGWATGEFSGGVFRGFSLATHLPYHTGKIRTLSICGGLIASLQLLGAFCVQARLGRLATAPSGNFERDATEFLVLRDKLKRFVLFVSLGVGAATLSTGALRNLVNGYVALQAKPLPPNAPLPISIEVVLAYGLFWTLLLGLAFLPVHLTLASAAQRLVEGYMRTFQARPTNLEERLKQRRVAEEYLGVNEDAFQAIKTALVVLSPLLGSLSGLLLPSR
ncbi:hypothetical protein [Archangium violaceum]|uniref:hypothetical protein n=1 Tax=Archangium violaceum TaxID=83451 RepID=UPI0036DC0A91